MHIRKTPPPRRDFVTPEDSIIAACRAMNASGLNQGTSGNISLRQGDGMLITPTSLAYDRMEPADLVTVGPDGRASGERRPSSEWRFHHDILRHRPDVNAVVHAHPVHATALALHGRGIPAVHYMVAIAGGADIRCAPYARFGTQGLSDVALAALEGRTACLLAHHGIIALGRTLEQALWLAEEIEVLARMYLTSLQLGEPPRLSDDEIEGVRTAMRGYAQV
ncbi:fuculose phosphate aldolase [Gemmobacter nanjingensis]|uniref:Fuculose phosphate aldolase n=1 Tax=Gemmobacter nanjingensis TaxID=488454 RepID=A0ABQ3FIN5_9RHOB|nr:class II aldolase/adducin family protein [Gemmobacter nanjingensis]GHC25003.1 fuculose phosphate aldolase [Gemmobacter nanjingensis]